MNWSDDYINIPFRCDGRDRSGCDCYGLVCLVYRERLSIELPDYKGVFTDQSIDTLRCVAKIMTEEREKWQKVTSPQEYDMVMLRTGRYTWHVGIVIDNRRMLHVMTGINSVVEDYTGRYWGNRVEEFRRWNRA